MKRLTSIACLTALALAAATAAAASPASPVKDTSFRDQNGRRVQQLMLVVEATPGAVWKALTTDEGFKTWAAPVAHIDLMTDGMIESSYHLSGKIGDYDNIRNQIVAYVPERLLVFRNVHAPKDAPPDFALLPTIRTVIEIADLGKGKTRIVQSGVGYGEGEPYDALFQHFSAGNAYAFGLLAESLAGRPVDWQAQVSAAKASAGTR